MGADGLRGGDKLQAHLDRILERVRSAQQVRIGFLENATYPDGTKVAMVAAVQEFGGSMNIPARTQDLNFKINANTGQSRFAKAEKANFQQTVTIPAHTVTVPPRPFFRNMLDTKAKAWGQQAGKVLKAADYDAKTTLGRMGELIKGQLQGSIRELQSPPLASSTVRAKGFAKPLIDSGHLLASVDYEVTGNE
jgi:hypothetical protein